MGHRCLIAYERDDGDYNVHYSHWGGHTELPLREAITEATPLGGDGMEPGFVNALMAALDVNLDGAEVGGKLAEAQATSEVEPEPEATGLTLSEICAEKLDFCHHEAFYVVGRDFGVRAFRTWRIHPPDDGEPFEKDVGNGVLVEWTQFRDDGTPRLIGSVEGKFRGARDAAQAMYESGTFDREDANDWLVRYARTLAGSGRTYVEIPEFSPRGHPAENCRRGGYATTEVPLRKRLDIPV
jgi:hypothetical protein